LTLELELPALPSPAAARSSAELASSSSVKPQATPAAGSDRPDEPAAAAGTSPPAEAEPAERPAEVPQLALPPSLTVALYRPSGQRGPVVGAVCAGVERTVTKAIGISAAGTTRALREQLYTNRDLEAKVTLYPRIMGYLIADALLGGRNASAQLVQKHRDGELARLTAASWRP
jgi:hypothetical protein